MVATGEGPVKASFADDVICENVKALDTAQLRDSCRRLDALCPERCPDRRPITREPKPIDQGDSPETRGQGTIGKKLEQDATKQAASIESSAGLLRHF